MVAILLAIAADAPAQEQPVRRTDLYGDPLPEGAIARLGTLHWRHGDPVTFVAFANGDKQVLSSCGDGVIHVWDVQSGKEVRRFGTRDNESRLDHPAPVGTRIYARRAPDLMPGGRVALSADGATLAMTTGPTTVGIWDVSAGKLLRSIEHQYELVTGLAFTPDGKTLATCGFADWVKLWEVTTGKLTGTLAPASEATRETASGDDSVVVSADGALWAGVRWTTGATHASTLCLWDLKASQQLRRIGDAGKGGARSMALSPDGKRVAWARLDGTIGMFDTGTLDQVSTLDDESTDRHAERLLWFADSRTLATLYSDGTIALINPGSGKKRKVIGEELPRLQALAQDRASASRAAELAHQPLGNGPWKGFFPAARLAVLQKTHDGALALTHDGKTIAQGWGNAVRLWNLETGKGNDLNGGHVGEVSGIVVVLGGRRIVTVGSDCTLRQWDVSSGKEQSKSALPGESVEFLSAISPTRILLQRIDGTARVWDVEAGKELLKVDAGAGKRVAHWAVSADGRTMAAAAETKLIRTFDLSTGKVVGTIKDLQDPGAGFRGFGGDRPKGLAVSPDGNAVAVLVIPRFSGSKFPATDAILLFDGPSGRCTWQMNSRLRDCRALTFSANGRALAVIDSATSTILVLETASGEIRCRLEAHGQMLAFSFDGRFLAVGSEEGSVKVLELRSGNQIAAFEMPQAGVRSLAFSRDTRLLFVGCSDGTTLVWDIAAPVQKVGRAVEQDAKTVESDWENLANADSEAAFRAVAALGDSPNRAVALMKEHLKPARKLTDAQIDKLITQLDSDEFEVRQQAFRELAKLHQAKPALQKAHDDNFPLEVRKRVEQILDRQPAEALREVRAVEVLETIGTPEARALLKSLAAGVEGARLTTEAAQSLQRLDK